MKDPAFLFYSSDFLTGVTDLTMEERGQYITLLCLQHQKGRLSKKMIGIAIPNAAADVLAKFKIDEKGFYYNSRLEFESLKRSEHAEKQRQRALDGWKKRKAAEHTTANAAALPLENENENEDLNSNSTTTLEDVSSKKKPTMTDFIEYAKSKKPNIDVSHVESKYESWVENGWKDGNDKDIKNWKIKLNNTLPYLKEIKQAGKMTKEELDKLLRPTL